MGFSRLTGLTRFRGRIARLGWGVADQAVSSVTNFALVFLVAHSLGAGSFGAFSLAYTTYGFALSLSRSLASYPLQVRYSGVELPRWRRAVSHSSGAALVTGIGTGALAMLAAMLFHGSIRAAFVALGLTLPGLLLQDSWRYAFFVLGRGSQAFLNDFVWALAQLPAMVVLRATGNHDVFWYVMAWGGAAVVAAAFGPFQARVVPRATNAAAWLFLHRDLASRYAVSNLVSSGSIQLRASGVGAILGLSVVGYVQAANTLMGPFMIIFFGIGLVTIPEGVKILQRTPERLPRYCVLVGACLAGAALLWGTLLLVALPHGLGQLALGSIWRPTYPLVPLQILGVMGQALAAGGGSGLGALGAAGRSLRANIIGALSALVCALAGSYLLGATGAMLGGVASGWILAVASWWQLRRAFAEAGIQFMGRPRGRGLSSGRHRQAGVSSGVAVNTGAVSSDQG
jgi:O-antigen/teichoic acid export membrane protein